MMECFVEIKKNPILSVQFKTCSGTIELENHGHYAYNKINVTNKSIFDGHRHN